MNSSTIWPTIDKEGVDEFWLLRICVKLTSHKSELLNFPEKVVCPLILQLKLNNGFPVNIFDFRALTALDEGEPVGIIGI